MVSAPHGAVALAIAGVLACGHPRAPEQVWPIAIEGETREVRSLAGEWRGEFLDLDNHRSGEIVFRLPPGGATGQGSVTFATPSPAPVCPDLLHPGAGAGSPGRTALRIGRLSVHRGSIGGWLTPYRDEQRRCLVDTWFMGQLEGDRMEGSFFVHPAVGDTIRVGTWWAARTR